MQNNDVQNIDDQCLKHHQIKKQRCGAFFLFVVLSLILTLFYITVSWMLDSQRLPLSKLVLEGELKHVTVSDVQNAFAQMGHIGTFMSQDVTALQDALATIPWVSHVSIRKQWPATIRVFLSEYQAIAIWNGSALLSEKGDVFNGHLTDFDGDKVKLYGPEAFKYEVLETWKQVNPLFQSLNLNITSLVLNDRHAWQIILDNGIRLELGKKSLLERIQRFLSLYTQLGIKVEQISYIDLRYDTGAAIGWYSEQEKESVNE